MASIFTKWKDGLAKTSRATFGQIATILGATEIKPETWDDLEALLIQADLGADTPENVLEALEKRVDEEGRGVRLGAADPFRAAAVDEVEIWAERLNLPVISGQLGGDAGAVAYDTVQAALARKYDIAIIDTAGRLHTRYNLMEELKKVYRVVGKALPGAPHAVWLVMDATTGQNGLQQALAFKEAVNITGVILAKLDTSARGGMALAIQKELGLPILFAGLGEQPDDLPPFDADMFIRGIIQEY